MPGYSATPLWKKLGYKSGTRAYVDGGPPNYRKLLQLPEDVLVSWAKKFEPGLAFVHAFVKESVDLQMKLQLYRTSIARDGVVWLSWPKGTSGVKTDVTENRIRELALPLGLVDIKVCAVDDVWSGLKLMIRKEQR